MTKRNCKICGSSDIEIIDIGTDSFKAAECKKCNFIFATEDDSKSQSYSKDYYKAWGLVEDDIPAQTDLMKKATFTKKLLEIEKFTRPGRVLDIGCANGNFLEVAKGRGWETYGAEISDYSSAGAEEKIGNNICRGDFLKAELKSNYFDLVTMFDVIEHFENPILALSKITEILKPDGLLCIVTPSLDSFSAKVMGSKWINYKKEHLAYFSKKSISNLLKKYGFEILELKSNTKYLNAGYIETQLQIYKTPILSSLMRIISKFMPKKLKNINFNVYTGELFLLAKKVRSKKILLLNPPGRNLYIRDYYCSKISQANYIIQPIDLLVMSSEFRGEDYKVELVDAIAGKISSEETLQKIIDFSPDCIITLVGAVSWEEDLEFLKRLKKAVNCKIIGSGDILREDSKKYLDLGIFDAIVTDFTTKEIEEFIKSETKKKVVLPKNPTREFNLSGNPYHELFLKYHYRYPFTVSGKFATVLTTYGCPFKCSFCIMSKLLYKERQVENVMMELRYLKSLGVNEIFFVDQTFGTNKPRTKELLSKIIEEKLNLRWFSFSRVDMLNEEMLHLMKKSGCNTLLLGVESGSDKILMSYRKGYTREDIKRTLEICHRLEIKTLGTFIFGLPDETLETANETLQFIKELPLDYASFNVAVPRAGTDLREQAISLGLVGKDFVTMDQSGTEIAMRTQKLSQEEVRQIKRKAVFSFYFRPKYILKRLFSIRSFYELQQNLLHAVRLFKLNE